MFSAGDRAVTSGTHVGELMGIAASGRESSVEAITIHRLRDGLIAEEWTVCDALGLFAQIGAVTATA